MGREADADLLPGYTALSNSSLFAQEYGTAMPQQPGLNILSMFRAAAVITIRQAVGLFSVARASRFLSDTLDWLNLWENNNQANDDLHYSEDTHLSLRL